MMQLNVFFGRILGCTDRLQFEINFRIVYCLPGRLNLIISEPKYLIQAHFEGCQVVPETGLPYVLRCELIGKLKLSEKVRESGLQGYVHANHDHLFGVKRQFGTEFLWRDESHIRPELIDALDDQLACLSDHTKLVYRSVVVRQNPEIFNCDLVRSLACSHLDLGGTHSDSVYNDGVYVIVSL